MSEIRTAYKIVSPAKRQTGIFVYLTENGFCWQIPALDNRSISLWHDDIDDCLKSLDLVIADMTSNAEQYNDLKHPICASDIDLMCRAYDAHTQDAPSGWRIDLAAYTGSMDRIVRDYDKTILDPPDLQSRLPAKSEIAAMAA